MNLVTSQVPSPVGQVNKYDLKAVWDNTKLYLIPMLLILIPAMIADLPSGWKYAPVVLYILNVLTDFLRKLLTQNKSL